MSNLSPTLPAREQPEGLSENSGSLVAQLPETYKDIRSNPETQFEPLRLKPIEPSEPSWFERALQALFEWLAEVFSPVGGALSSGWQVIQWILVAALALFVAFLVFRLIGPLQKRDAAAPDAEAVEPEWRPERTESLALLEDADRLAAAGDYDAAAHLLLKRSVGQIANARPDWVEPSSTARELAALPRLSDQAKRAFAVMSAAVESSLFALESLSLDDWKLARSAYADFALARIDRRTDANAGVGEKAP